MDSNARLSYDRDFLISLQHTGNKQNLSLVETLQSLGITKESEGSIKKTYPRSPGKQTPVKVYVPKVPPKLEEEEEKLTVVPTVAAPIRVPLAPIKKKAGSSTLCTTTPTVIAPPIAVRKENFESFSNIQGPSQSSGKPHLLSVPQTPTKTTNLANDETPTKTDQTPTKTSKRKNIEKEDDPHRLAQRQKQIDYGKKTVGYQRYISKIPIKERVGTGELPQPTTPRKHVKCSKRSWDGQVKKWRRELHQWDPTNPEELTHWKQVVEDKFGFVEEEEDDVCLSPGPKESFVFAKREETQITLVY